MVSVFGKVNSGKVLRNSIFLKTNTHKMYNLLNWKLIRTKISTVQKRQVKYVSNTKDSKKAFTESIT